MSGLARYFHAIGVKVSGYDKTSTTLTKELENEGIHVHYEDNPELIPESIDIVCYTPAIPKDNKEYQYLINKGYTLTKRSEVLGLLTKDKFTIAVAGTHGKTSITSLIAHLLKHAGLKVTAFIGGISKNYNSNIIMSENPDIMIVEADEYDRSFLTLHPDIAVITAMDADHLDIYGSENNMQNAFIQFAGQIKKETGVLVISSKFKAQSLNLIDNTYKKNIAKERIYSLENSSQSTFNGQHLSEEMYGYAENIKVVDNPLKTDYRKIQQFDIITGRNKIENVNYHIPGKHNIENAVAAAIIAEELGVGSSEIKKGLETYEGVLRRFDYKVCTKEVVYIDDYAHHPEELIACISAVKEMYNDRKITGIFQPHLYTRTRDLAEGFAKALNMLDELILLDIYPARELPIEGVSSEIILKAMDRVIDKNIVTHKILCRKEEVIDILKNRKLEVLLTLGAGDIDTLVDPITALVKNL